MVDGPARHARRPHRPGGRGPRHRDDRAGYGRRPHLVPPPAHAGRPGADHPGDGRRPARARHRAGPQGADRGDPAHPLRAPGPPHGRLPVGAAARAHRPAGQLQGRHLVGRDRGHRRQPRHRRALGDAGRHGAADDRYGRRPHGRRHPVAERPPHHRRVPAAGAHGGRRRGRAARAPHRGQRPRVRDRRARPGARSRGRPAGRLQRPAVLPGGDGPGGRHRPRRRVGHRRRGHGAGRHPALRRRRHHRLRPGRAGDQRRRDRGHPGAAPGPGDRRPPGRWRRAARACKDRRP
jgi:hypothetical protein